MSSAPRGSGTRTGVAALWSRPAGPRNRPLRTSGLVAAYSEGHAAAGRLHDAGLDHPQVTRFVTWYFLERGDGREVRPLVAASVADKVAAVQDAQRRGTVADRMGAGELLALVLVIATMWQRQGEDVRSLVPASERRRVVVESVRQLATPLIAVGGPLR
ncbi:hypothetical protein PV342_05005 [Streptomyces sp. PA03-3a]|nr:hypothetical protein [Streptomyces sp. PA03-3a]